MHLKFHIAFFCIPALKFNGGSHTKDGVAFFTKKANGCSALACKSEALHFVCLSFPLFMKDAGICFPGL